MYKCNIKISIPIFIENELHQFSQYIDGTISNMFIYWYSHGTYPDFHWYYSISCSILILSMTFLWYRHAFEGRSWSIRRNKKRIYNNNIERYGEQTSYFLREIIFRLKVSPSHLFNIIHHGWTNFWHLFTFSNGINNQF